MSEAFVENKKFVETPYVKSLVRKALFYLKSGFPIHFSGPAGTGKTTLAMHVAAILGKPIVVIHGNDEFTTTDLVGGNLGIRRQKVIDNFIHSVWKGEESIDTMWSDGRLTQACRIGGTLVYDEFTRSRPEANNVMLAVLEEKILELSQFQKGEQLLKVHPEFSAIFTSNPEEYAGVHKYQDALRDRMITIDLSYYDLETEVAIGMVKSNLPKKEVEKIANLVSELRCLELPFAPSIRATIMIAKISREARVSISKKDPLFGEICFDVLMTEAGRLNSRSEKDNLKKALQDQITKFC